MTDALARLSYQLFYGKVRPDELDPDWNVSRPLLERSPAQVLLSALETTSLPQLLVELRVDHPSYAGKITIEGQTRASLSADLEP